MTERRQGSGRRTSDNGWVLHARENWYRDVWLLVITVAVILIAVKALNVARDASTAVQDVQRSRITNCQDQNLRHRNAVIQLNGEIASLPPIQRRRARAGEEFFLGFINRIAPFNPNCNTIRIHPPK